MLSSSSSEPERRNNLTSTIKIATRVLLISTLALAAFCLLTVPIHPVHASSGGSLSLGTVTGNTFMVACGGGQWLSGMTCYSATITGCANVDNINFIYGYLPPSGAPPQGVITYFDGGDGTSAVTAEPLKDMLSYYAGQNYGVVEIAWGTAWEHTTNANIQNAACRPATFLNYVYNNIYLPITTGNNGNPNAGMCAQGFSAGSTAITYSLAYYGALNQLDAVELISGPVLSDIEQGCEVPQIGSIDICEYGMPTGHRQALEALPVLRDRRRQLCQGVDQRQQLPEHLPELNHYRFEPELAQPEHRRPNARPGTGSGSHLQLPKHRDERVALHPASGKSGFGLPQPQRLLALPKQLEPAGTNLLQPGHNRKRTLEHLLRRRMH